MTKIGQVMTKISDPSGRILLLIFIMAAVVVGTTGVALVATYRTAFQQQRARLIEAAQSQARLMEAVAQFDAQYSAEDLPGGAFEATLGQIRDAHGHFAGFGETGELEVAKREGDQIVFLLAHRPEDLASPGSISFSSQLAEPMRRALSGQSGSVVALDCHGQTVLAAYEPVAVLELGIVAKIDLAEIRAPFIKTGLMVVVGGVVLIASGAVLFLLVGDSFTRRLQTSEKRYRSLFEDSHDAIGLTNSDCVLVDANKARLDLFGYPREEMIGHRTSDLYVDPEDRLRVGAMIDDEGSVKDFSVRFRKKNGAEMDCLLSVTVERAADGTALSYRSTIRDITEQKRAEETLQASRRRLRNLASRLHAVGEEERTTVAREMQDELGQALIAMRMDLDWLSTRIHKHEKALHERAASIMSLVDSTFETVRGISQRLRPPMLDDLGLEAAVEWHAEDFGKESHLDVQLDLNIAEVALDTAVVTAVFRILQEALTNVARHAGASHVKVTLGVRDGRLVLEVMDDGKGITDRDIDSADALGLIGMRERAGSFGGRVSFKGTEEGGTKVKLTMPLRAEEGRRGSVIRLMIADGYSAVRQDLRRIVEECSDMKVVGEAVDAHDLFTKLDTSEADVLLLDVAMPGMEFTDIMERLRARPRQFPVLVLSVRPEDQFALQALRAEASGYLCKNHWPTDLAEAIRHVNRGGRYGMPTLAEKLAFELDPTTDKPLHESLSAREYQVLCMLASGKSVKEIGAELDVSPKTVSTYRTRILEKIKLKTTADLIRYAVERHLEL